MSRTYVCHETRTIRCVQQLRLRSGVSADESQTSRTVYSADTTLLVSWHTCQLVNGFIYERTHISLHTVAYILYPTYCSLHPVPYILYPTSCTYKCTMGDWCADVAWACPFVNGQETTSLCVRRYRGSVCILVMCQLYTVRKTELLYPCTCNFQLPHSQSF